MKRLHVVSFDAIDLSEIKTFAVVATQLVEQSLPIPKIRSSNPVIAKTLYRTVLLLTVIKPKRPRMDHLKS